jgi:hypothetical protein
MRTDPKISPSLSLSLPNIPPHHAVKVSPIYTTQPTLRDLAETLEVV